MSLFLSRKRSGMVLTGVVLSSGVVSAVNQGVAGAVPQNAAVGSANTVLNNSNVSTVLKGIGVILFFAVAYFLCAMVKKCFSEETKNNKTDLNVSKVEAGINDIYNLNGGKEENDIRKEQVLIKKEEENDIRKEQVLIKKEIEERNSNIKENVNNGNIRENKDLNEDNKNDNKDNVLKEEQKRKAYSVNGEFKNLFCSDKVASDKFKEKFFEKTSDFEGCVLNMSVDKLVESCDEDEELEEFLEEHKNVERVDVLISKVGEGYFVLDLLDEQGKALVKNIDTKYAVENENALNSFCNNFDSNKRGVYFKEMPFGKVFRYCNKGENYKENVKGWKEIKKFEKCVYNTSKKELRRITHVGDRDVLEKSLKGDKQEIKIRINSVEKDGYLWLDVLDEKNNFLCKVATGYATTDADDLNKLETYLSENKFSGEMPFSEVLRYDGV